jgi:hypothetical protein
VAAVLGVRPDDEAALEEHFAVAAGELDSAGGGEGRRYPVVVAQREQEDVVAAVFVERVLGVELEQRFAAVAGLVQFAAADGMDVVVQAAFLEGRPAEGLSQQGREQCEPDVLRIRTVRFAVSPVGRRRADGVVVDGESPDERRGGRVAVAQSAHTRRQLPGK